MEGEIEAKAYDDNSKEDQLMRPSNATCDSNI